MKFHFWIHLPIDILLLNFYVCFQRILKYEWKLFSSNFALLFLRKKLGENKDLKTTHLFFHDSQAESQFSLDREKLDA